MQEHQTLQNLQTPIRYQLHAVFTKPLDIPTKQMTFHTAIEPHPNAISKHDAVNNYLDTSFPNSE